MPTIILLDVSLSMCRTVNSLDSSDSNSSVESIEIKQLANVGIGTLLDYFAQNAQLEQTALVVFSSLWEIRNQFTRHHESIKDGIYDLELYDKSNVVNAVRGLLTLKLNEQAQNGPINIILITDGYVYHESMCKIRETDHIDGRHKLLEKHDEFQDIPLCELEGQFNFPCKMQVVCLTSPHEPALKHSLAFYKSLVSLVDTSTINCPVITGSNSKGHKNSAIWLPESDNNDVTVQSVEEVFLRLAEMHYRPFHATLTCGHLSSMVALSPKPTECLLEPLKNDFDDLKIQENLKDQTKETYVRTINKARLHKLSGEIMICGFMPIQAVESPAVISRHLILPIANSKFNETSKAEQILSQDSSALERTFPTCSIGENLELVASIKTTPKKLRSVDVEAIKQTKQATGANDSPNAEPDITKRPSFCVLLHNCLKQENLVAICIVGKSEDTNEDWYGVLHAHTDSKKRSSLMLSLLVPSPKPIPWLPSFRTMSSSHLNANFPQAARMKTTANHTQFKSYTSNNVIWLDPESVQADVQKIVRHAKKSPDKAPLFYKELNRIRRAAISYGFYDVLFGLATILEREARAMRSDTAKPANQEMLGHIEHVVNCLRAPLTDESYDSNILPKV